LKYQQIPCKTRGSSGSRNILPYYRKAQSHQAGESTYRGGHATGQKQWEFVDPKQSHGNFHIVNLMSTQKSFFLDGFERERA
jgi:hypothetical protein